jgi:amino acid transporter
MLPILVTLVGLICTPIVIGIAREHYTKQRTRELDCDQRDLCTLIGVFGVAFSVLAGALTYWGILGWFMLALGVLYLTIWLASRAAKRLIRAGESIYKWMN